MTTTIVPALFLDFDGVMHPAPVWRLHGGRCSTGPRRSPPCWTPIGAGPGVARACDGSSPARRDLRHSAWVVRCSVRRRPARSRPPHYQRVVLGCAGLIDGGAPSRVDPAIQTLARPVASATTAVSQVPVRPPVRSAITTWLSRRSSAVKRNTLDNTVASASK